MPPLIHNDDEGSDVDVPANGVRAHPESGVEADVETDVQADIEADVEAKNQLKDDLMSEMEETRSANAAATEPKKMSPPASDAGEDDDDEEVEEQYEVEAIRAHEWRRKKGKGQPWILLYNVKWRGYPESENTLEPEENLIGSRDILAAYHRKIGGAPQPPTGDELKKKKSSKSLRDDSMASATDDSPAPPAKRQKRSKQDEPRESEEDEFNFGNWTPKGNNWEKDIREIQTVERDEKTNDLFILMVFKNGRKSRVKNRMVREKCPQRLLDFYEAHLNFSVGSSM